MDKCSMPECNGISLPNFIYCQEHTVKRWDAMYGAGMANMLSDTMIDIEITEVKSKRRKTAIFLKWSFALIMASAQFISVWHGHKNEIAYCYMCLLTGSATASIVMYFFKLIDEKFNL